MNAHSELENLPDELKSLNQWVLAGYKKIPYQINGLQADVSNPTTWNSFDVVKKVFLNSKGKYKGIGFVFTEKDDFCGIDLDDSVDEKKNINDTAKKLIEKFKSYTEFSCSGSGIHIIVKSKKPGARCKKGNFEIYDRGRYFIFTGNIIQNHNVIEERQELINNFYRNFIENGNSKNPSKSLLISNSLNSVTNLTNKDIIEK
jgi:putative DNA primase/helicase